MALRENFSPPPLHSDLRLCLSVGRSLGVASDKKGEIDRRPDWLQSERKWRPHPTHSEGDFAFPLLSLSTFGPFALF